ncbi:hypothetical protein [Finch poxvirus]|uniref:Uncharacterized protein n=1 Tax=Condorpox virus TaxID=3049970 RepID=A0AAT9UPA6_9POXV|nr:hypothetical protein [Finch poxvirus]UOX39129.1 hypothetical protein [Finch poxvirus]
MAYHPVYDSIYRKELTITLLICLINIVKAYVEVTTPESYILSPKHSNVELICNFTDDQKAKLQDLIDCFMEQRRKNYERNKNYLERERSGRINCLNDK